jgi:hypothetical protein
MSLKPNDYFIRLCKGAAKACSVNVDMIRKCKPYLPEELRNCILSFLVFHSKRDVVQRIFVRDPNLDLDISFGHVLIGLLTGRPRMPIQIVGRPKYIPRGILVEMSAGRLANLDILASHIYTASSRAFAQSPCNTLAKLREDLASVIANKVKQFFIGDTPNYCNEVRCFELIPAGKLYCNSHHR